MTAVGWCPECGPVKSYDEDGCCSCGCTCTGPGADKALKLERSRQNAQVAIKAWRESDRMGTRMANRKIQLLERDVAELRGERDAARAELEEVRGRRCETCKFAVALATKAREQEHGNDQS
jgi:hypothetical protein